MIAKMQCTAVTETIGTIVNNGEWVPAVFKTARLSAVTGGSDENKSFSRSTPSANLEITVSNPEVVNFLQPGKNYYIKFSEEVPQ